MAIRVAVIGGGLAGASLAASLCMYPHLQVKVYEAAPVFSEQGAAVGIGKNGQRALQLMAVSTNDSQGLLGILKRAGGVANRGNRFIVGAGKHAGEVIFEMAPNPEDAEIVVHRAALLEQLLLFVPERDRYTSKQLERVEQSGRGLVLRFADKTSTTTDVLIGADGIHGSVRRHVLGAQDASCEAVFAGFWDARVLLPIEEAVARLGEHFVNVKDPRQHDYIGDGVFFIHDIIDEGKTVALAIAARTDEPWPSDRWKAPLEREELIGLFKGWPLQDTIVDTFLDQDEPLKAAQRIHAGTRTYARDNVAIMGDAAHAMVPFQASGATQSLEDALVLSKVLGMAKSTDEVSAALLAYDAVRRPRSGAIAASSLVTGRIMTGGDEEAALDPEKLAKALGSRWEIITKCDLEAHFKDAQALMQASLGDALS